jgi:hypothetical protein
MRRVSILLALSLLALAASADVLAAQQQGMTRAQRIRGNDHRGKYDIAWVRLTERFSNAAVRARVNADLEREARSHICDRAPNAEQLRYYEAEYAMEVTYLGPRLLGIKAFRFLTCGGPSPSKGTTALLYDLRTGRRLTVEDEMADPRAFRRFVARRVLAARPHDAGECADLYTLEDLTRTGYIYLVTARTLQASQDYPNVVQACGYDVDIAWADVVRFLKPGSPLRTLVPGRA